MARRKKKKARQVDKTGPKSEDGFGTLAAQVKAARRNLRQVRRADAEQTRREQARRAADPPPEKPRRRLTEEELMAEAFDSLGDGFSGSEKYLGEGFDASDVEVVAPDEPEAPATGPEDDLTTQDLVFLEAMSAEVQRLEDHRTALRDKEWAGVSWRTEAEIVSLSAEDLERLELSHEQRELLRRSRKVTMQVVNVRRFRRGEAIGEVEAFVRDCVRRGDRFVRVVHGKGRHSEGEPVLKPAVIRWCEGAGSRWVRAWAPEIDRSGRFGSLVVELRRDR